MATTTRPTNFRGVYRDDAAARGVYSEAAGIAQIIPRAVAVPADAEDVAALVRWAARYAVPLIPRGSGSSMAGGAIGDGVIVDLSRLNALSAVDVDARTVRCEPGVLRNAVDAAARKVGLSFPVDPSSGAYCTVGGMASTNSSGAHTLRYGPMRPWVNALDCVFADGSSSKRILPCLSQKSCSNFISRSDKSYCGPTITIVLRSAGISGTSNRFNSWNLMFSFSITVLTSESGVPSPIGGSL